MDLDISSRVLHKKDEAIILDRSEDNRYFIKYLSKYNRLGNKVTSWVSKSDIKIDIIYYRNLKIDELLK